MGARRWMLAAALVTAALVSLVGEGRMPVYADIEGNFTDGAKRAWLTPQGGLAVAVAAKNAYPLGTIVQTVDTDNYVSVAQGSGGTSGELVGVMKEATDAEHDLAVVIIAGRAQVLMTDSTAVTAGDILYVDPATMTGRALALASGYGVRAPFKAIGTALESNAGGTDQVVWAFISPTTPMDPPRFGGAVNYSEFEADGTLKFNGAATVFDDLRIEPTARTTGANTPTFEKWYDDAAGTSRGAYLFSFDDASVAEKELFFTMQLPHSWKVGTDVNLHVHWVGAVDDTTAAPIWGLEYAWKDIGEVFGDTAIVYTDGSNYTESGTDADVTANKHYISKFAAITPGATQNGVSSILIARIFRRSSDASDTYNASGAKCGLLYVDAHFEIDTIGSRTEYAK